MKKSLIIAALFFLFLSALCFPVKKIEMKIFLTEKEDDANYQFYMARDCALDDDLNLYIVDAKECLIKKYDKSGKFVLSFGKKGNGPGEISFPYGIEFSGGKIYIPQFKSLDVFSTGGVFEKSLPYPKYIQVSTFNIIDGKIAVIYGFSEDKFDLIAYPLDDPGQKIKSLVTTGFSETKIGMNSSVTPKREILFAVTKNNKIIFGFNDELKIKKYSLRDDSVKTIITFNYTRRKIPEETIKAMEESFKARGQSYKPPIPEYLPMIKTLAVDDEDNIWLHISSNEKSGLMKFDKNGNFLEDYQLMQENMYVGGGKIIVKKNFIYSFGISRDEGVKVLRGVLK